MTEIILNGKEHNFKIKLKTGKNNISNDNLEELKKNKWFNHLVNNGTIIINGEKKETSKPKINEEELINTTIKRKNVKAKNKTD